MSTEITTGPIPTTPIELSSELEYDLNAEDFVACWRFIARESPQHLPQCVVDASEGVVERFHFIMGFVLFWLSQLTTHCGFGQGPAWIALLLLLASGFFYGLGGFLRSKRAGIYLNDIPGNPWRWAYMRCLRSLARREAKKGRTPLLDILSHYRFARNPEGFTLTAEYQQRFGDRLVTLWRRQDEIAWRAVEVVGRAEQHVFFVIRDCLPVIVPRSCFADDNSFYLFALAAKHYHEARDVFIPPSGSAANGKPQLNLPRSQAVMAGPEDRFGPRPI